MSQPELARLNTGGACLEQPQNPSQPAPLTTVVPIARTIEIQSQLPSPMQKIPVEILEIVMWEVVKDSLSLPIIRYYIDVTRMRLVCRHWTQVLEAMPAVWANLSPSMDERLIDLALSRSIHSSLTIKGYLFLSPALDKLFQHIYRWGILDVSLERDNILDRLCESSAPLLEELSLAPTSSSPPRILFNDSAPMLRVVDIRDYGVQWNSSIFSNLRELSLSNVEEDAPDVDTLLKLLSNSPQLTRLEIWYTTLTPSDSPQARVSLPSLHSLELHSLGQGILKQLLESIEIPTSTTCQFTIEQNDYELTSIYEQLEPIGRRLSTLAGVSRGSKSTFTLGSRQDVLGLSIEVIYEGEAPQLGALGVEVEGFGLNIGVVEYFASQLGQDDPNPVPPSLHFTFRASLGNEQELLQRLPLHLPDTEEISIENSNAGFIGDAINTLFPRHSSRPFPRLSTLIIRKGTRGHWADGLQSRQKLQDEKGGGDPLPLKTLKIEGGSIGAKEVEGLKKLVPNLVLDGVEIE
ncbi:hypothetical protein FRC01_005638 [Tulasnella sp. 417]|nr:hypothetical protein FRC01_005638 [Tulasnella sp. 417]